MDSKNLKNMKSAKATRPDQPTLYVNLTPEEINNLGQMTSEELELIKLISNKITELENNYIAAQKIKIQNGHTFIINLRGDDFRDVERQVNAANILGKADLIAKDLDGVLQVIKDIPKALWITFYEIAKVISVDNLGLKSQAAAAISLSTTIEEVSLVNTNPFPAIETIVLDIP